MKKNICFAGFSAQELEALHPSLKALDKAWSCIFSPDAEAAIEALAAGPFDAIVINLNHGGINDSKLLQQSAGTYPSLLRFILGDMADRQMIVNCVGAAHQFISRPWKPHELTSIIERSFALDAWLSSDKLRSFIPRLGTLPGLPSTYFEVIKRVESPSASVESVTEIIARDPALTARLLQMANSPACGLGEKITHPGEAVAHLGLDAIKSLVLCLQLFSDSDSGKKGSLSLEDLWRHSFAVAKLSSKIVLHCIASERMASDAYTAGLLHNIGRIVLATNLAEEYAGVVEAARKKKCCLHEMEQEMLGVTSSQVGAYLLGLWGMPLSLVEAVALHITPGVATPAEFTLLTVVHIADVLAYEEHGAIGKISRPKLDATYLATLGLPEKPAAWAKLLASPAPKEKARQAEQEMAVPVDETERPPKRHSIRLKLGLVMAVAIIGFVVYTQIRGSSNKSVQAMASAVGIASSTPASSSTPAPDAAAPASDSPLDAIKLQSILYSSGHPMAIVNGQTLEIGSRFSGIEVASITRNTVVLAYKGQQKTFTLK